MSDQELAQIPADKSGGFGLVAIQKLDPELKQALKDTVAKDTTDTELAYFLTVAKAQELNPWMKEVWCIKMGGRLVIMTSSDGYLKIAKRDPQFDSIQAAEVREGDHFMFDAVGGNVEHRISTVRGEIIGAYAIITRTDGKKFAKYVSLSEYVGQSEPWRKYKSAMIQKAAKTALCKEWANITGIMAEEMMPTDAIEVDTSPAAQATSASLKDELLAKIEACKTIGEFDALKATMPPVIGKLFDAEKREVYAAANAKKAELLKLDVKPKDEKPEVVDAEMVAKQVPAIEADEADDIESEEAGEEVVVAPKATVDQAKKMLRECDTLESLDECWNNVIPTLGLDEAQMQAVEKTYKMRIPLITRTAPQKEKAA